MFRLGIAGAASAYITLAGVAGASEKPGENVTARPIEGTVLEERFQNQIIYRALQELGYEIAEPQSVEYQTIHLAIGAGDGDFTTVHYDPLHDPFFEESGGEAAMSRAGHLIKGAVQGYLVDKASYDAGITNIGALADPEIAARFDTNGDGSADLAGCPPGWGCERVIEHHLTEYGLRDTVTHNQGAYNAVIADTIANHQDGKPVIYYTWTPYWVSGVLVPGKNVEWLEVPYTSLPDDRADNTIYDGKNLGFSVNELRILANKEFLDANPAAAKLFELAEIDIDDVSAENYKMREGEDSIKDIDRHVDQWIETNRNTYDSWIAAAREAAKG
ncbi:glycine betaine/L-proline ABC transporter substrate-binding protein ProX [Pontibaca salina]|uniref:Glycine betaine/L-proline ABC transporter substrate-binding protein ProX n=1 Tax=Pontibaca salina TaxID=2795731 RepID=A0A934HUP6_9RHOB|nr:glycine betaine/L-proline ABC transporter substrate-binding protein ProX [Pontibaca salina]MBI6630855.1 glycine betaine/L-proline ABC transporter substrate-binding protein ProX [Pontibaca salina]